MSTILFWDTHNNLGNYTGLVDKIETTHIDQHLQHKYKSMLMVISTCFTYVGR